jgi:hypothetical protein
MRMVIRCLEENVTGDVMPVGPRFGSTFKILAVISWLFVSMPDPFYLESTEEVSNE